MILSVTASHKRGLAVTDRIIKIEWLWPLCPKRVWITIPLHVHFAPLVLPYRTEFLVKPYLSAPKRGREISDDLPSTTLPMTCLCPSVSIHISMLNSCETNTMLSVLGLSEAEYGRGHNPQRTMVYYKWNGSRCYYFNAIFISLSVWTGYLDIG